MTRDDKIHALYTDGACSTGYTLACHLAIRAALGGHVDNSVTENSSANPVSASRTLWTSPLDHIITLEESGRGPYQEEVVGFNKRHTAAEQKNRSYYAYDFPAEYGATVKAMHSGTIKIHRNQNPRPWHVLNCPSDEALPDLTTTGLKNRIQEIIGNSNAPDETKEKARETIQVLEELWNKKDKYDNFEQRLVKSLTPEDVRKIFKLSDQDSMPTFGSQYFVAGVGLGDYIILKGKTQTSIYAHLSEIFVGETEVQQGDRIGAIGGGTEKFRCTRVYLGGGNYSYPLLFGTHGTSSGPHMHVEVSQPLSFPIPASE